MLLLKVLLPILLSIHLLAADISSSRHRNEPHIIVIITVSDTEMVMECILSDHQVGNGNGTFVLSSEVVLISEVHEIF